MVKTRRKRKLTKEEQKAVGRKIRIIKKEDPGKPQKAVVGKAIGMVTDKRSDRRSKKRKKKCRRKS